ncbi:MAG: COX15/CtaA family protein, partial [Candidatus Omnitrophica bacterium]|nr:COX15/CtaA family protein [Candidatus Omnitrophota bacterium]
MSLPHKQGLRIFSKITCLLTLFLIFAGGMVTSTNSGLSVPDWPLSYGTWFPPMIGGVFYEHGHRMIASLVGFFMLILTIWIGFKEQRQWVRYLAIAALGAVVIQGILGGMTVLFFLPTPISVSHAVLAQTFFLLTIFLAYSQSNEYVHRVSEASAAKPVI